MIRDWAPDWTGYILCGAYNDQGILVKSKTSSGKTTAVLIAVLSAIVEDDRSPRSHLKDPNVLASSSPSVLILSPTRKVVAQIWNDGIDLARFSTLQLVVLYGGTPIPTDVRQFEQGCDNLIATPGRLKDMLNQPHLLSLLEVRWLIMEKPLSCLEQCGTRISTSYRVIWQ